MKNNQRSNTPMTPTVRFDFTVEELRALHMVIDMHLVSNDETEETPKLRAIHKRIKLQLGLR